MKITFCINTTKFELEYVKLLFHYMAINFVCKEHEILVFVENDTDTKAIQTFLLSQKSIFPNLKIIINPLPIPVGYANNINMLFEMASHNTVSYLQADMCPGPCYDAEVIKSLEKFENNVVLSSTRIEPDLHPPSPEKITQNFGIFPEEILSNLQRFNEYVNSKKDYNKITDFFFAPFTIKDKNKWIDIGGHDTLFRRSREDSDILYRMTMLGYAIKQCWNSIVYHRSCVSSRGNNFFSKEGNERAQLQQVADRIEMYRFLRKWGSFKHDVKFDPEKEYKYHISTNFYHATPADVEFLQQYYPYYHIYIDDIPTRELVRAAFKQLHAPANKLFNISDEQWNYYQKYYRTWQWNDIYTESPIINDDIIYDIDLRDEQFKQWAKSSYYMPDKTLIHEYRNEPPGEFELEGTSIKIKINRVVNHIQENIVVKNPPINDIPFVIL